MRRVGDAARAEVRVGSKRVHRTWGTRSVTGQLISFSDTEVQVSCHYQDPGSEGVVALISKGFRPK